MKNKKPLVSVIMPVYNAGDYLVEAIESILNQTMSDFEFLIIDDHSTDNSLAIIKKYSIRDKRIKIFRNSERKGLVLSLNFLIPKTKGMYIARMDADDISFSRRFEKQIDYLENHKEIVACGGQELIIDQKGKVLAEKYFPTDPSVCYNSLMNFMVIQPPLLMARGDIFRIFRYDNHVFKNDDITMHFKLLKMGSFGNVDQIIFKYRKHNDSLTHQNPKKVYFLALKARLNAILNENYRPGISNIILTLLETLVVILLPENWVLSLFEYLRFKKENPVPMFLLRFVFRK